MNILKVILSMSMLLSIMSCAIQYDIVSEAESQVNFSKYKTYAIIHDDHGFEIGTDSIHKQNIDKAIESEIEDMGYGYSEIPDLQISWFIKVDTHLEQGIYNAYYSKWRSQRAIEVYEYQVGSLVIDIVDTQTGKVVWHGNVSGRVEEEAPNLDNKINKVVKDIFNSYKRDTGLIKVNVYAVK